MVQLLQSSAAICERRDERSDRLVHKSLAVSKRVGSVSPHMLLGAHVGKLVRFLREMIRS